MSRNALPDIQSLLLSNSLVSENYIPLYLCWASKLLAFSNSVGAIHELPLREYQQRKNI